MRLVSGAEPFEQIAYGDGDDESPVGCHDVHLVEAEAQS